MVCHKKAFVWFEHCEKATTEIVFAWFEHDWNIARATGISVNFTLRC